MLPHQLLEQRRRQGVRRVALRSPPPPSRLPSQPRRSNAVAGRHVYSCSSVGSSRNGSASNFWVGVVADSTFDIGAMAGVFAGVGTFAGTAAKVGSGVLVRGWTVRFCGSPADINVGNGGNASRDPGIELRMADRSHVLRRSVFASKRGAARHALTAAANCCWRC